MSNCMPPASLSSCKLFVTSGAAIIIIDYGPRYIPCQYAHVRHLALRPPLRWPTRAIPNVAQNLLRCRFEVAQLSVRHRSVVGAMSLRHQRHRIPYVAQCILRCRFEVAPLSLRHRSVVAALSLHYRRAIECLLRLPVYACVSGLQMFEIAKLIVKHYPRQSYDFASSRGQLHQVDLYY